MITAPKPTSNRTIISAGTHVARLIGLIHMGTAEDTFQGEPKMFNKIRLTWEFPEETKVFKEGDDAKPLVLSQEYTFSMGKKSNLRPIVEGIIGTALTEEEAYNFNFEGIIGIPCLASIKHKATTKGSSYATIASTAPLMKGQACKSPFNEYKVLTFDSWNEDYFQSLPEFIKDKIKKSNEYKALKGIVESGTSETAPF